MKNDSVQTPDASIFGFPAVKQTSAGLCTSVPAARSLPGQVVNSL